MNAHAHSHHPHEHTHDHDHGDNHAHGDAGHTHRPPVAAVSSLLMLGLGSRLGVAAGLIALLWAVTLWALA